MMASLAEAFGCMSCPQVGASQVQSLGFYGLAVSFGSLATTVRREYYTYSFISFVSDVGGSLGLFVGFSFFAVWDLLIDLIMLGANKFK